MNEYGDGAGSIVMDAEAQAAHRLRLAIVAARSAGLDRHQVDRVVAEAHGLADRLHTGETGRQRRNWRAGITGEARRRSTPTPPHCPRTVT